MAVAVCCTASFVSVVAAGGDDVSLGQIILHSARGAHHYRQYNLLATVTNKGNI